MAGISPKITEQAVLLGSRTSLVGILARMVGEKTDRPAIVILNTGLIHRVGYNRMFVGMSRALAAAGYLALRFDFSGIGDSEPPADARSPLDSCMADLREVVDWLEATHRASRVILVGLCSGADHAVLYGHTDSRVVGLVLLDPSIPPTARHVIHYMLGRLIERRSWVRLLTGRSRYIPMAWRLMQRLWRRAGESPGELARYTGSRRDLEQHYLRSVQAGITILAVFTGDSSRQTYRDQMLDAFPGVHFGDLLRLEFFPGSDHVFSLASDRSELTRLVLRWADAQRIADHGATDLARQVSRNPAAE